MAAVTLALGIFFQITVGGALTFLAIFAGASLHDRRELTAVQALVLNNAVWLLPAIALAVAAFFVLRFATDAPRPSLLWHLVPVAAGALYLAYASTI